MDETSRTLWKRGPLTAFEIGDAACPILRRYTLTTPWLKFRLHHFYPGTSDRDYHDHPWPFLTFVLHGGYIDERLDGRQDKLSAGSVRYRSAHHAHKTFAGPKGCWTFVVGPHERREWGFFVNNRWMDWRTYTKKFGSGMSCDETP
jgi:hypothetical protein